MEFVLNIATQYRAVCYLLNMPQITGKIQYRQYPCTLYNLYEVSETISPTTGTDRETETKRGKVSCSRLQS